MDGNRWERWGAASGFGVLALGAMAAVIDAGTVSVRDPVETITAYFVDNRAALLAQSLLFVISAGIFVWFLGSLRGFLPRAEGRTGRLSEVAFGAGMVYVSISLAAQAFQIGLAMAAENTTVQPALLGMAWALFSIASVPARGDAGRDRGGVVPRQGVPGLAGLAVAGNGGRLPDAAVRDRGRDRTLVTHRLGHLCAVPLVRRVAGVDDGCDGPPARHAAGRHRDSCHTPRAG